MLDKPAGRLVQVDGKNMNVYVTGQGEKTLVFLAGGGTTSPILDFKSLYSKLEKDYRVVIVERLGYGFSDDSQGDSRDIDTVLFQTRQALKKAEIKGPYTLVAHSMAGLEALHWATKYPEEIQGIIGLDMALPSSYTDLSLYPLVYKGLQIAANLGLSRVFYDVDKQVPALAAGDLTAEEKQVYKALFYRRPLSNAVYEEVTQAKQNAEAVSREKLPELPILLFSSNGQGTGYSQEEWQSFQKDFAAQHPQTELILLDCPHYVHDYGSDELSEKIKQFLK
ncbi:alpha/beta fold hydrolase [Streptococcus sinensis]|uniref:alpha/beta fold hydrolase n=1 Tax=Streptococcus sinensis TaxID=176090 RepID=UPI001F3E8510|nr:alpha/beta hydrolase [Streptococcus sinensis]MCF1284732.1 alpha/beta hydrolase [Streptococcus sinensis]